MAEIPAVLREVLEEPTVIAGIPMTLDRATQAYGRQCMAAALRWASKRADWSFEKTIAALEANND